MLSPDILHFIPHNDLDQIKLPRISPNSPNTVLMNQINHGYAPTPVREVTDQNSHFDATADTDNFASY
ncbi:hypothetical protein AQUCO_06700012v1 [Aquilegia coerulea]|uniref:Uncharacterized protein n=1 Tax=Aquilegia coerulea TaxID=218851 RepID=A0A2G5CBN3_AQUCA|nr:hypothetical protein AQUCO_06700012v1 [Aquilegia coerulea]